MGTPFWKYLIVREPFVKYFQNKTECFGMNWKFQNILKIGQFNKQVRMFRDTSENVLMFRNTFEIFPKQILIFRNKLKVSEHSENKSEYFETLFENILLFRNTFWNVPKTNLNVSDQSWKFSSIFLKCSQNKLECFRINWKFRNILKTGPSTKQVTIIRNTFENILMF